MADRKGRWARLDEFDAEVIEQAVKGQVTRPLSTQERVAAVRELAEAGMTDRQIAARLWWWRESENPLTAVSVYRYRHQIPPGVPCTRTRTTRAA